MGAVGEGDGDVGRHGPVEDAVDDLVVEGVEDVSEHRLSGPWFHRLDLGGHGNGCQVGLDGLDGVDGLPDHVDGVNRYRRKAGCGEEGGELVGFAESARCEHRASGFG